MNLFNIEQEIAEYEKVKKQEIIDAINGLKIKNKNCKRISSTPPIFVLSLSEISKDKNLTLDASYYDYEQQFDFIIKNIEKRNLTDSIKFLKKIIKDKSFKNSSTSTYKFHDKVIQQLRTIVPEK